MKLKETTSLLNLLNKEGIFSYLYRAGKLPSTITQDEAVQIDINYYLTHSSSKLVSQVYFSLQESFLENVITNVNETLAQIIGSKFYDKWSRIYKAFTANYEILEDNKYIDTSINEYSKDSEHKESVNIINTNESTSTNKENSSVTTDTSNENNDNIYGFNSTKSAPSNSRNGKSTITVSGDKNENFTELQDNTTQTTTGSLDDNKKLNLETYSETNNVEHKGNSRPYQELLESELEFRKNVFYDIIMNDVDSILTLNIY